MLSSSDITRARRQQTINNDLIGGPKPHNLSAVNKINCIITYAGPSSSKTLPKNLKCLLRPRTGGIQKPEQNPKCCR
jgi:hypothetical protein